MKSIFIYALKDPDTGQIRYIGASIHPNKRFTQHLSEPDKNHRTNWIKSLTVAGMRPVLSTVDEVPEEYWQAAEAAYIQFYRELGCRLVNGTDGGEGGPVLTGPMHPNFGKHLSLETCAKIGAANSGEKSARFGKPGLRLGQVVSLETRKKQSSARLGKKPSLATRQKMRAAKICTTLETREKMSLARLGNKNHFFGKSHSEVALEKMRLARKQYWITRKQKEVCAP